MELNVLKVDLDIKRKDLAINHLKERFSYMHDIAFLDLNENTPKIELVKKTSYGCRIEFGDNLKSPEFVIIMQLLLGSDWQKEVNTIINHFKFKMEYSNRLFDVKRYYGNKLKKATKIDVTQEILAYINLEKRKKKYN